MLTLPRRSGCIGMSDSPRRSGLPTVQIVCLRPIRCKVFSDTNLQCRQASKSREDIAGVRVRLIGSLFQRAASSVVEHLTFNQGVPGSIPGRPTNSLE